MADISLPPQRGCRKSFENSVRALIRTFRPKEIWIFGSCARKGARWDSDVDMLVVKETHPSVPRPGHAARMIISRIKKELPVDLIVVSPEHWEKHKRNPQGVYIDVVENGILVYAR